MTPIRVGNILPVLKEIPFLAINPHPCGDNSKMQTETGIPFDQPPDT